MAAYGMALIASLEHQDMDKEVIKRLYGAGKFLEAVTRPDGVFTQIGDNDSGLFFRLSPTGGLFSAKGAIDRYASLLGYSPESEEESYLDENMNDGRTTISATSGLFKENVFLEFEGSYPLEHSMVRMLCGGFAAQSVWKRPIAHISPEAYRKLEYHYEIKIDSGGISLLSNLRRIDFPEFGVYIFRSDTLYLLVNASDNGQKGNGGHAHNDKLSFELLINGVPLYEDPGSYVYTALPEMRNKYRSVKAHAVIYAGMEQNEYVNIFSMKNQCECTLFDVADDSICLIVEYQGIIHRRKFKIENKQINVIDDCNIHFEYPSVSYSYSAGYGKILK
jgi:hypothetical protein